MAEGSGRLVRISPRFCRMHSVKVALGSREMTIWVLCGNGRRIGRSGEPWSIYISD